MKSDDAKELLSEIRESLHYTLDPDMTYISMLRAAQNNAFNREKLQAAFNRIQKEKERKGIYSFLFCKIQGLYLLCGIL